VRQHLIDNRYLPSIKGQSGYLRYEIFILLQIKREAEIKKKRKKKINSRKYSSLTIVLITGLKQQ